MLNRRPQQQPSQQTPQRQSFQQVHGRQPAVRDAYQQPQAKRLDDAQRSTASHQGAGYASAYRHPVADASASYADSRDYKKQVSLLHKAKNICRNIVREPIIIIAIIVIALLTLFIRPFLVPSGSMVPTLIEGDRILSIATYFPNGQTFQEGDIACFTAPDGTVYVKRVIANGGDLVQISGEDVYVNGELSPWQGTGGQMTNMEVQLADDEYFMMGDNRGNSEDSRFIGPIKADKMISKVVAIYMPFDHATLL